MQYVCLVCDKHFVKKSDNAWQECPQCKGDAWWEDSGYIKGTITSPVVPSWRKYEKAMRTGDPHDQFKAAEMFTRERDKATKSDYKMARWEKSRKEWFIKQKPKWVKQGRKI